MDNCLFCRIASGIISSKKLYENDNFFSVYDINPKTKGHSLVISKKHFVNVLDLPETLGAELLNAIKETSTILKKEHGWDGFNLISNNFLAAGQAVEHFHLHLLPRKEGDGVEILAK